MWCPGPRADPAVVTTAYHVGGTLGEPPLLDARSSSSTASRPSVVAEPSSSGRKLIPSGLAWPFGYGPSWQPATSHSVGARSMFITRSLTVRGPVPSAAGQDTRNGTSVVYGDCFWCSRCSPSETPLSPAYTNSVFCSRPSAASSSRSAPTRSSTASSVRHVLTSGMPRLPVPPPISGVFRTNAGLSETSASLKFGGFHGGTVAQDGSFA